jgi:hypothetical protein
MRTDLFNACANEFHTDPKYSIMHVGLFTESDLNEGQTLFQDMCDRLHRGAYGQASELALIACTYNLEIIIFENGTQQWVQRPTGPTNNSSESIHYDWLKKIKPIVETNSTSKSDEYKQANHLPESLKLGPKSRDTDNLSPPTSQKLNRSRQSKNKSSRCSSFSKKGTIDSSSNSAGFGEEVIYSQVSPKMDEIIRDFD